MKFDVEAVVFDLEDLWEQRQKALEEEEQSMAKYKTLDEDVREALADLIDQALQKMREDKSWLPYAIDLREGSVIDVRVRILFSDITEEIIRRRAAERAQILDAKEGTAAMIAELSGGAPEGDDG